MTHIAKYTVGEYGFHTQRGEKKSTFYSEAQTEENMQFDAVTVTDICIWTKSKPDNVKSMSLNNSITDSYHSISPNNVCVRWYLNV